MKYLNKYAHLTGRKFLSNLSEIYMFKINNGNTRKMCQIYSKFRGLFRSQSKLLTFACLLFLVTKLDSRLLTGFSIPIPLEVNTKDTRTVSRTLFLCFYCWLGTYLAHWFSCIFHILPTNFTNSCFHCFE